jgi:hypothetical protein
VPGSGDRPTLVVSRSTQILKPDIVPAAISHTNYNSLFQLASQVWQLKMLLQELRLQLAKE